MSKPLWQSYETSELKKKIKHFYWRYLNYVRFMYNLIDKLERSHIHVNVLIKYMNYKATSVSRECLSAGQVEEGEIILQVCLCTRCIASLTSSQLHPLTSCERKSEHVVLPKWLSSWQMCPFGKTKCHCVCTLGDYFSLHVHTIQHK